MTTLTSLLVGMHFNPPAKQLMEALPSGMELHLIPDPDNPYDANALTVRVDVASLPAELDDLAREKLEGTGFELDELRASDDFLMLGHVAASGGKPLAKAGLEVGNVQFLEFMAANPDYSAKLAFAASGAPLVMLSDGPAASVP